MTQATDTAPLEPRPTEDGRPTVGRVPPRRWLRENLFSSRLNGVLTVLVGGAMAWVAFRFVRFVLVTGRWEIVQVNLVNFMVGQYPREQLWRMWLALALAALVTGVTSGLTAARGTTPDLAGTARRAGPLVLLIALLLGLTRTPMPALLAAGSLLLLVIGWGVGRRLPQHLRRWLPLWWVTGVVGVFLVFTSGGPGWQQWGGLHLTLFLAIGGIVLSFPLGVVLALGRRSSFPGIRLVCVAYIELIRGVPLITLLFMSVTMIGFFFPPGFLAPATVTRGLVAFVLFTAAYVAEIVRGGLQGVPRGQVEAAQALGLRPWAITRRVVLPQALRNVIPALVGQFISLFKDTSLIAIVGVLELLRVAEVVHNQPAFQGQRLQPETFVFVSFVYWAFCYSMSRASQRLETRLGVGER